MIALQRAACDAGAAQSREPSHDLGGYVIATLRGSPLALGSWCFHGLAYFLLGLPIQVAIAAASFGRQHKRTHC